MRMHGLYRVKSQASSLRLTCLDGPYVAFAVVVIAETGDPQSPRLQQPPLLTRMHASTINSSRQPIGEDAAEPRVCVSPASSS